MEEEEEEEDMNEYTDRVSVKERLGRHENTVIPR